MQNQNAGLTTALKALFNTHPFSVEDIMKVVREGANPNIKDSEGDTPLMQAVSTGNEEVTKLLISKGADVNAKNSGGESVLAIAKDYYEVDEENSEQNLDETPIIKILKKAGAK